MPQSPQDRKNEEKVVSRRDVVKGGTATLVGAFATLMATRRGSAAVTGMDQRSKKGGAIVSTNAVTSMD